MSLMKAIIAGIALLIGGWLTFDGTRALVAGNYITAKTGPYAGQLGPWSRVVSAFGLDPQSRLMKCIHVFLGVLWLTALTAFVIKPTLGWQALLLSSVFTLWYLPMGTVLSVIELCLLLLPQIRNLR